MSPFVFFVSIFVLAVFGFCNGPGHACLWWRNPSCAYFSACWPGLLRVSRGNCFFFFFFGTMVFLFHADAFPSEQFSEHFRQTTKNGSKGAFSVLSPFVVFVLFLSSSFLVLRWLWPRMLVHRHCGLIRLLHLRVLLQPASFFRKMKKANAAH